MKSPALVFLSFVILFSGHLFAESKANEFTSGAADTTDAVTSKFQPLESIRLAVESFVVANQNDDQSVSVTVKSLDQRLRLVNCQTPLEPTWANRSRKLGRVTVKVACASPQPWRIHVQATVTMQGMVWKLVRGVRRGDIFSGNVVVRQEVTLGANNAAFSSLGTPIVDIEPWLGFAFAQPVNAGKVLNERMLIPAKVIGKGDSVVIRHRARGLELQTRGVALSDAGAQQLTQVRNSSSGKVIDVVVVSPGIVEILQ